MSKRGLSVLPGATSSGEFFKVLDWILSRTHDLHGSREMARRRAESARALDVINDDDYQRALEIIKSHEKEADNA